MSDGYENGLMVSPQKCFYFWRTLNGGIDKRTPSKSQHWQGRATYLKGGTSGNK